MKGAPTDNNATLFAQGYDAVLAPYFSSGKWTDVGQPGRDLDPTVAASEFQQAYTAHKNINAALVPERREQRPDHHLPQAQGIKPKTFPTTGQDATLTGLRTSCPATSAAPSTSRSTWRPGRRRARHLRAGRPDAAVPAW
jgi:D-xylose transport system substrate-binding protein